MARYQLKKGTHSAFVDGERVEYVAGSKGHDILELTDEQAKLPHFRKRVERLHDVERSHEAVTALDFTPDDDDGVVTLNAPGEPVPALHVLAGNEKQVLAYIDQHADDEDALANLRKAETVGKRRKKVLDALNDLLGE